MRRVLFVDDERQILDGLRLALFAHEEEWDVAFALGGEAALKQMRAEPFDVVVSDMRMPVMDGATLLERVRREFPTTARIILSGHAEQESVVRALQVAHQFLNKPCETKLLFQTVERTCALRDVLGDERLRRIVGQINHLPSMPWAYQELARLCDNADTTVEDIADLVERDSAMAAKFLQLVNSAYFGLRHRVVSVRQAVNLAGMNLIRSLARGIHGFGAVDCETVRLFGLERTQAQATLIATLARAIAPPETAEAAYAAGLVAGIGQAILVLGLREEYLEFAASAPALGVARIESERDQFGLCHCEVGAYLLGVWGLPVGIVDAVRHQSRPSRAPRPELGELMALHVAKAFVEAASLARDTGAWRDDLDMDYLGARNAIGLLPGWEQTLRAQWVAHVMPGGEAKAS